MGTTQKDEEVIYVTIDWGEFCISYDKGMKTDSNDTRLDEEKSLYMILTGIINDKKYTDKKLHYIGQTYDQTPRIRIPQDHDAYDELDDFIEENTDRSIYAKIGTLTVSKYTTENLLDSVENALIYYYYQKVTKNKFYNKKMIKSYTGYPLIIHNIGQRYPLPEIIDTTKF